MNWHKRIAELLTLLLATQRDCALALAVREARVNAYAEAEL